MAGKKIKKQSSPFIKIGLYGILLCLVASLFILFRIYKAFFLPSVDLGSNGDKFLFIRTGSEYQDVFADLNNLKVLSDARVFEWLAKKKNYPANIHPGRYRISKNMSNYELLNMLRAGKQEPLMLTFNNVRTLEELAGIAGGYLEPDSVEILSVLRDTKIISDLNFTKETFPSMFIPNSYEFYWNTSARRFLERMSAEYVAFWSKGRFAKAAEIGYTPQQVSTLASIIDQETIFDDENPRIAGVFLNRIKSGIPLQSDPTIIFACSDFSIKRVLNKQKTINSPYNTYTHKGLPPGPISIPSVSAIDAVLNYEKNNYLYFCAKDDFSGYHNFASTLSQHNENARLYQKAMNKRKVFR